MSEYIKVSGKTVEDAITNACTQLQVPTMHLEYEVLEQGSNGFFGIFSKPAIIKARKKNDFIGDGKEFLEKLLEKMNMNVQITTSFDEVNRVLSIDLSGADMGVLIGKRGQTLDSLQHLVGLVVNKQADSYVRVKLDSEDYRAKRKESLETLAKNVAQKVKRNKRSISLEPMNPYERRIIHAALQEDVNIVTRSEGAEPFRHVVIALKRERRNYDKKPRYVKEIVS